MYCRSCRNNSCFSMPHGPTNEQMWCQSGQCSVTIAQFPQSPTICPCSRNVTRSASFTGPLLTSSVSSTSNAYTTIQVSSPTRLQPGPLTNLPLLPPAKDHHVDAGSFPAPLPNPRTESVPGLEHRSVRCRIVREHARIVVIPGGPARRCGYPSQASVEEGLVDVGSQGGLRRCKAPSRKVLALEHGPIRTRGTQGQVWITLYR